MTRLAPLLLASAFGLAAQAQSSPVAWRPAPAPPAPTAAPAGATPLDAYAGHYASDGGGVDVRVDVRADGPRLVVVAFGAPVAARLAALAPEHAAVDARAQDLLDAWVAGDLAPLAAAAPSDPDAARRFGAHHDALVAGLGGAVASTVVGTFRQTDGRHATLAQVLFEHGVDWLTFVWDGDALGGVLRGLGPVVLGELTAHGPDAFAGASAVLAFDRGADGRVAGLSLGGRPVAAR